MHERSPTHDKSECGCAGAHWHARVDANREHGPNRNMGTSGCPSNGGTDERGSPGVEDAGAEEESKGCKEDTRDCSRKRSKTKEQVTCKIEMGNSCITMSRNCLACGKGGIGMTTQAEGLIRSDPELCAKARREEVEYIRHHKDVHESPQRGVPT